MDYNTFISRFDISLNDQQIAAMRNVNGQTLLLAVPGSGKTTTLVCRIGYMIYVEGIAPQSILVLTFSTAAASDMQARYIELFGREHASQLKFRTIHSICYGIIMRYSQLHNLKKPDILSDNYGILFTLYREVYEEFPSESDIKSMQLAISQVKNLRRSKDAISKIAVDDLPLWPLYDRYQQHLERTGQIDFDDQLVLAYEILSRDPSALSAMQEKYRYLLVDEAQDTSKIQHDIIVLLARKYRQIFMVGDEDQSIYGFRAAYPEALLEFGKVFPAASILKLERNYRSTPEIVTAADIFIRQNRKRYAKNMSPVRTDPGSLTIRKCKNRSMQYEAIAEEFLPGMQGQTAILYRNNDSAIPLAEEIMKKHIPFKCKGMEDVFFTSKAVVDMVRIMRSAFAPYDAELFLATYSLLGARIKKAYAVRAAGRYDKRRHSSIWEALLDINDIGSKNRDQINAIIRALADIRKTDNARIAINRICDLGYKRANDDRVFLLKSLAESSESVAGFIDRLSDLKRKLPQAMDKNADIVLSTIHASKGLEYDNVILIDALSPIFPSSREDIEEERRLFYVAMTRARNNLVLLKYAGQYQPFITSIEKQQGQIRSFSGKAVSSTDDYHYKPLKKKSNTHCDQAFADHIGQGVIIRHKVFGKGVVTNISDDRFTILFEKSGSEKVFSMVFAETHSDFFSF